jgi:hypothetical protein
VFSVRTGIADEYVNAFSFSFGFEKNKALANKPVVRNGRASAVYILFIKCLSPVFFKIG